MFEFSVSMKTCSVLVLLGMAGIVQPLALEALAQNQAPPAKPIIYDPYADFDALKPSAKPSTAPPQPQGAPAYGVAPAYSTPAYNMPASSQPTPAAQKPVGPAPDPLSGMIRQTGPAPAYTQPAPQPGYSASGAASQYGGQMGPVSPQAYFQVTQTPQALSGNLKDKYQAMVIVVKNAQPMTLEILNGEVVNGIDPNTASREAASAARGKSSARGFLMSGLGYIPYVGYGTGAVSSAANYGDSVQRENDENNMANKTKTIPHAVLNPNEIVSLTALVPKNQRAIVKFTFRDLRTNETFTVSPSY